MTRPKFEETSEDQLRWEFIEEATKQIENWTQSEKAEIHPEIFFKSEGDNDLALVDPISESPWRL